MSAPDAQRKETGLRIQRGELAARDPRSHFAAAKAERLVRLEGRSGPHARLVAVGINRLFRKFQAAPGIFAGLDRGIRIQMALGRCHRAVRWEWERDDLVD